MRTISHQAKAGERARTDVAVVVMVDMRQKSSRLRPRNGNMPADGNRPRKNRKTRNGRLRRLRKLPPEMPTPLMQVVNLTSLKGRAAERAVESKVVAVAVPMADQPPGLAAEGTSLVTLLLAGFIRLS